MAVTRHSVHGGPRRVYARNPIIRVPRYPDPDEADPYAEAKREFARLVMATNRKYAKCMTNGGHKPSDVEVLRTTWGGVIEVMVVCRRCEVPYFNHPHRRPGRNLLDDIE